MMQDAIGGATSPHVGLPWGTRLRSRLFGQSEAPATSAPEQAGDAPPAEPAKPEIQNRWNFETGTAVAPGRTILKRLGGGSAYEVFLVWDTRLHAIMVAKLLRPGRVGDERSLRELRREAGMLERLAHPSLVRGYGCVLEGEHPHLLLEVVEGVTLGRLIKRQGALPVEQVLPIALYVTSVLHYLATERVVHLDVKPGNIVMSVTPKLIDLSIARALEAAAPFGHGGRGGRDSRLCGRRVGRAGERATPLFLDRGIDLLELLEQQPERGLLLVAQPHQRAARRTRDRRCPGAHRNLPCGQSRLAQRPACVKPSSARRAPSFAGGVPLCGPRCAGWAVRDGRHERAHPSTYLPR